MKNVILVFSMVISFFVSNIFAHEVHTINSATKLAVSFSFDQQGQLWRASVHDGFIFVDKSIDNGETFSNAKKLNKDTQKIAARGEARPNITIGPQGNIYLTWTQGLKKRFAGYVWFSRSVDGGKTFESPKVVHQDRAEITHRFDALTVSPDGKITVVWIDKRDLEAAKKTGEPYTGAAIYYAVSTDDGKSFLPEKKLADFSCECCRIATSTKPDGTVAVLWRHVFEGSERDHAIAEIPKEGAAVNITRATFGHWKIDGCPHHGAALARGGDADDWWGYHIAYFDGKDNKPGLYYSRMDGEAWVTFPARKFGDNAKQARHPAVLSMGDNVWLAWLETGAKNVQQVMAMSSIDEGKSWSEARSLLTLEGKVDYPQLLNYKDTAYLVVNTSEGLKVNTMQP